MITRKLPGILSFEWDKGNKQKSWIKHSVTVEEVEEACTDAKSFTLEDTKHSAQEVRSILLGKTKKGRVLFIVYTFRKHKIRVISARDANKKEVNFYEKAIIIT